MEIKVGKQISNGPGSPGEQGEDAAFKPLFQTTNPGTPDLDRSAARRETPGLAVAVPVAPGAIDLGSALIPRPAQERGRLLLQNGLEPALDLFTDPIVNRLPRRHGLQWGSMRMFLHGDPPSQPGLSPGFV